MKNINNSKFAESDKCGRLFKKYDDCYLTYNSGFSESETGILYHLYHVNTRATQKEICENALSNKQTVNSAVKRMRENGLLEISPSEKSKREKILTLTDKGRECAEKVILPMMEAEERALLKMGKEKRELYFEFLELHAQLLEEEFFKIRQS